MSEGHPAFVANNGRIGFGVLDHARYAPESGAPVRLEWLAARRSLTHLALGGDLTEERLYREELGEGVIHGFRAHLTALGEDPDDYVWLPVHPWQMEHKIAVTFAPDHARRDLVHLGTGEQQYRAQQSIRTFYPMRRESRYVKTACAIQKMGFLRGLSPAYMRVTPAINEWVLDTLDGDPVLTSCGFTVLPEVASIGYTGDAYHQLGTRTAHTKMVAALWRDHPAPLLAPGERLATLAGTLHRDRDGVSLLGEWVCASTVEPEQWVRALLRAYVRAVVHCLRVHRMAFMPHSENLVLVLGLDHVPARAIMKDIGEEVAYLGSGPCPTRSSGCGWPTTSSSRRSPSSPTSWTACCATSPRSSPTTGCSTATTSGPSCASASPRRCATAARWPPTSRWTGRPSPTRASTGSSCATPCRWSTRQETR